MYLGRSSLKASEIRDVYKFPVTELDKGQFDSLRRDQGVRLTKALRTEA
jgi:hypothetical protein